MFAWIQANTAPTHRALPLRPLLRCGGSPDGSSRTSDSSLIGDSLATPPEGGSSYAGEERAGGRLGARARGHGLGAGGKRASCMGGAGGSRLGGPGRRSALGAVLEAHAADEHVVDPQEQVGMSWCVCVFCYIFFFQPSCIQPDLQVFQHVAFRAPVVGPDHQLAGHGLGGCQLRAALPHHSGQVAVCRSQQGFLFTAAPYLAYQSSGNSITKHHAVECSSASNGITTTTNDSCTALALQLPLDDVVLSHSAQLDLFVQNLRRQLTDQAAAAKVAKAEAAAAAAAAAAGNRRTSGRRSRSRHTTPRSHYQQPGMDAAGDTSVQVGLHGTHVSNAEPSG